METDPRAVLDDVVKIVNHIKFRPLNARMFKLLCEEIGSEHTTVLLHRGLTWLYREIFFVKVFELHSEFILSFLSTHFIFASVW
jgi:hypothetical protein